MRIVIIVLMKRIIVILALLDFKKFLILLGVFISVKKSLKLEEEGY